MSEFKEKVKRIKEEVAEILDRYPYARENDFYLQLLWLKYYSGISAFKNLYIDIEDIKKIEGKLKTIERVRRLLQHNGLFLPNNPRVLKRRRLLAEAYRQTFGGGLQNVEGDT